MIKSLIALVLLTISASQVWAVPPTVTPSPGYDRALAESRRQRAEPPAWHRPPLPPRDHRRTRSRH